MADGTEEHGTAGGRGGTGRTGPVDLRWARRQLVLTAIGTVISVVALSVAAVGLLRLPLSAAPARPYAVTAVVAAALLAAACIVLLICWLVQLPRWRADPVRIDAGYAARAGVSLVAHLASYLAVLVAMYGALAASAMAYWDSLAATLLGITFLLAIFGQILGGTQLLRRGGPPATIPYYLRLLNEKVQSLR